MDRTINTLFMLMTVDGKISTGADDQCDVDTDFPTLPGVAEGLHQYYDLEQHTDLWSFNSARVLTKIGFNTRTTPPSNRSPVSFVLVDNGPHFNQTAIHYLSALLRRVVIVTTQPSYHAYDCDNVDVIHYDRRIDFTDLFTRLHSCYGVERVTIQSGGTLNGILLRAKLLDFVNIVVAPVLVGGSTVSTLIDGPSPTGPGHLADLGVLQLRDCRVLQHSYLNLIYQVVK